MNTKQTKLVWHKKENPVRFEHAYNRISLENEFGNHHYFRDL